MSQPPAPYSSFNVGVFQGRYQSPYAPNRTNNLTPRHRYRQQTNGMEFEVLPGPSAPPKPSAAPGTPLENLIMGPPTIADDPDYERELQRQLSLLPTDGFSSVYLDRLRTGSMYRPDVIPFQLNSYLEIERQQIARMMSQEIARQRSNDWEPQYPQQPQHSGIGWRGLPPPSNPLNTPATRQLQQYDQQPSPYVPRGNNAATAGMPYNFAMPPPPRPSAYARPEGSPQRFSPRQQSTTPPRGGNTTNSPITFLPPQTPQSPLGPILRRAEPQVPQQRSDIIARESFTFLQPQTPERPSIQRPEPQALQPSTTFRQAWQQASSQSVQAPRRDRQSAPPPEDEGRWYIPPHERQRFLSSAPPAQSMRQEYIPEHERLQASAPATRDNHASLSANHSSARSQPRQQQQPAPGEPRRGSFSRPNPPREVYIPRHLRVEGGEAQSPLFIQQEDDEGDDTDDAAEVGGFVQREEAEMRPPARPLWTRKRKSGDDGKESDADGSATSAQYTGGRELWTRKDGSS